MGDLIRKLEVHGTSHQVLVRDGSRYTYSFSSEEPKEDSGDKTTMPKVDKQESKSHLLMDGSLTSTSEDMLQLAYWVLHDLSTEFIRKNNTE